MTAAVVAMGTSRRRPSRTITMPLDEYHRHLTEAYERGQASTMDVALDTVAAANRARGAAS